MYIDPNSGGMLFQVLLVIFGVFTGAIFLFYSKIKIGIASIRRKIREKFEESSTTASKPD